jgi:phosphatidylinositol alpha-mannosyltransferase
MKVLMVSETYYPYLGGISDHIYYLSRELRSLGHTITVLTSHFDGCEEFNDPDVLRAGRSYVIRANKSYSLITLSLRAHNRVRELMAENQFDVVHIHGSLAPTLPLLAIQFSRGKNVFTFHAAHSKSRGYKIFRPLLLSYFRKLDGLIAVSAAAEDAMSQYFPGRYKLIPNGVDTDEFSPAATPRAEFMACGPKILYSGRFEPRKGLEYLLAALPKIQRAIPDVVLIIVGGGPFEPYYRSLVPKELEPNVRFAGIIPQAERRNYYASCDLFCSPAVSNESFGIVLLEAMASGKPVLASDIPGYNIVIRNGKEGILVPPKNPETLAAAAIKMLKDRTMSAVMGEAGRSRALCFSWPAIARQVSNFYSELLEKSQ